MAALSAGTPETPFGGIGVLRLAFNVAALGNPSDIIVTVSVIQTGANESTRVPLGTFPATATANAGVIRIGVGYSVRATAALAATPSTQIGQVANVDIPPLVEFNTMVTISHPALAAGLARCPFRPVRVVPTQCGRGLCSPSKQ